MGYHYPISSQLLCFNEGEERCILGLVGKPEGKRPLGRPSCRWDDNIKMNFIFEFPCIISL